MGKVAFVKSQKERAIIEYRLSDGSETIKKNVPKSKAALIVGEIRRKNPKIKITVRIN